jgi:outer membrane protein TolC
MKTLILALILSLHSISSWSAEMLSLNDYLTEVKSGHEGFKAAMESMAGSELRKDEYSLYISPGIFASASHGSDAKPFSPPFVSYSKVIADVYSIGVTQATTFGLSAKLSYNFAYYNFVGLNNPSTGSALPPYYTGSPTLELTQSLWKNGFGSEVRATMNASQAGNLANQYAQSFRGKQILSEAEAYFWRLVSARQILQVQQEALERAQKIYDWNARRAKVQLTDKSDLLQSEAAFEARKLEMQAAQDEEKAAALSFNMSRGKTGDAVAEKLTPISEEWIDKLKVPTREKMRDDVKAAEQNQILAISNASLSVDKASPTLDLFGNFGLNSQEFGGADAAFSNSFKTDRPTYTFGVRFSAALAPFTAVRAREGWRREQLAAEITLQRRLFEQEQDWTNSSRVFEENKRKLVFARKIEAIQKTKANHERDRLKQGRTTTYQMLLFEQDSAQAQLATIRAQSEVLRIYSQLKLFQTSYGAE